MPSSLRRHVAEMASFYSAITPTVSSDSMTFPSSADCLLDPMLNLGLSDSSTSVLGNPGNLARGFNRSSAREQGLGSVMSRLHAQCCHGSNGMTGFCPCLQYSAPTLPSYPQHSVFSPGLYPSSSPSSSLGSPINDAYLSSGFQLRGNNFGENFLGSSVSGRYMRNHGESFSSSISGNPADIAFSDRSVIARLGRLQDMEGTENDILNIIEAIGTLSVAFHQQGSRYLQKFLSKRDSRTIARLFSCLVGLFDKIMQDQFGNYLFLKLLQVCSFEQLREIVRELTSQSLLLIHLSISEYGSWYVQRLITRLKKEKRLFQSVTSALFSELVFLITHPVGSRVIQHCLKHLEYHQNELIFLTAISSSLELGRHERGCIRLVECLDHSRWPHRGPLLRTITSCNSAITIFQF